MHNGSKVASQLPEGWTRRELGRVIFYYHAATDTTSNDFPTPATIALVEQQCSTGVATLGNRDESFEPSASGVESAQDEKPALKRARTSHDASISVRAPEDAIRSSHERHRPTKIDVRNTSIAGSFPVNSIASTTKHSQHKPFFEGELDDKLLKQIIEKCPLAVGKPLCRLFADGRITKKEVAKAYKNFRLLQVAATTGKLLPASAIVPKIKPLRELLAKHKELQVPEILQYIDVGEPDTSFGRKVLDGKKKLSTGSKLSSLFTRSVTSIGKGVLRGTRLAKRKHKATTKKPETAKIALARKCASGGTSCTDASGGIEEVD